MPDWPDPPGKAARLILVGSATEIDRRALEDMKDPLLHLLRNALDHGLEVPAERQRLGKPAIGGVVVGATQRGNTTVIEVEDDGAGISVAAVRRAVQELLTAIRLMAEVKVVRR